MSCSYTIDSPVGSISITSDGEAITEIRFGEAGENCPDELCLSAAAQLGEYFAGKRHSFELPLKPHGTEFQKSVWAALCDIPYGETDCYSSIAEKLGKPKASRAVGTANNKNPIAIVIPCHRCIGKNGKLIGYASGLAVKEFLLGLENNTNLQ